MPVELLEKIFLELDDIKVNKVILSGGEASLHPQFDTILSILKKYKFTIGLFTNGLLSDEVIKLINESNISSIYLSLDGTNDNYNRSRGRAKVYIIEENLRKIKKKIIIMNTLNSQNYLNVEQFIEYCNRQNKIQKINFNPIKILHNSYQNMELTKEMLCFVNKKINEKKEMCNMRMRSYYNLQDEIVMKCTAGISSMAIDSNGDVSGCIFGTSVCEAKYVMGNIFKEKIMDIWKDKQRWSVFFETSDSVCESCCNFGKKCTGLCCIEKYIVENRMGNYLCGMR